MNREDTSQLIDHFLEKKRNGMEFTEIRKALQFEKINEEEIKAIIRIIDNKILQEATALSENRKAREQITMGVIVCIAGLLLTIATYTGIIGLGNYYILAYGPIIGGLGLLLKGYAKFKRL